MTPGERIGPYEIEAPIGEGGMGEVFRARDTRLQRTVAIKLSKTDFTDRFEREARAIAALNHPHICTLYDVGPNYLVMEHIEGAPLKGPLPVAKAVEYASQILDALAAAHQKGFTHRDLKPANILVTKQGIKLLDFGLAKQTAPLKETDATLTQALTGQGQILGTLQYISPEQLQGREADARSDLFAFGCVLYEMLSGKRAFEGASAASIIAAILEREPVPLDLHPPLGRVIAKCLAKDPDERFQNARDLKYNLALAMEPRILNQAKTSRWPWAAAAATLVLGALGGWLFSQNAKTTVDEQAVRFQLTPPEGGRFDESSLAVSADGRLLAYVVSGKGPRQLWVRPLDGAARALPGTDGAFYPFWSPDSRSLGYIAAGKMWRIDLTAGAPTVIGDAPGMVLRGTWGDSGLIISGANGNGPLRQVSASGGAPVPLTKLDASRGESYHAWPQFLPSGRSVLFYAGAAKAEDSGIYAARLDNPTQHSRIVATTEGDFRFAAGYLLWRRGTTLMAQRFDPDRLAVSGNVRPVADPVGAQGRGNLALAASSNGVLLYGEKSGDFEQLTWFNRAGESVGTVGPPGVYTRFAPSPDGRRLVVCKRQNDTSDLWTVDLERDAWSRLTFSPGTNDFPVWSPDGNFIVFSSGNPWNLIRKNSNGAGSEERIAAFVKAPQYATSWSRDGRSLLYHERDAGSGSTNLWVLPVSADGKAEPGAKARPYRDGQFDEDYGRFSPEPNPRWVAYTSNETGRREVFIQAYPQPTGKWMVSNGGGSFPAWGPDGRELFYASPDGKLMAVKLTLGADSVQPSASVALFNSRGFNGFAVAPDGKRFLMAVRAESAPQPLQVILNWPALLK